MKKKTGGNKALLIIAAVIAGFAAAVALSLRQPDLGIEYTQSDYLNFLSKLDAAAEPSAETPADAEIIVSAQEISAYINESGLVDHIAKEVQLKLTGNNGFELSGKVDLAELSSLTPLPSEILILPSSILEDVPVYTSGTFSANSDSRVSVDITTLRIGSIPLPDSVVDAARDSLENSVMTALDSISGLYIEELSVRDGKLVYKGVIPVDISELTRMGDVGKLTPDEIKSDSFAK